MRRFFQELKDFPKKCDWVLLMLCLVTAAFGLVVIASSTSAAKFEGNARYIIIQMGCILVGVVAFAIMSSVDIEVLSENRNWLVVFNVLLLLMLIPFGTDAGTGNRSWLDFPLLPFNIQPAEVCKITYVVIMASVMNSHKNSLSGVPSIMHMVLHLGILVGLNMAMSRDAGVSLIFVFIFIGMAFAGGVHWGWFALAIGGIALLIPFVWPLLGEYQQERILILIDPTFDAQGIGARYQRSRATS